MFYLPCYDHNGNIVAYVSEAGDIAAQFVYDPYGHVIEQYGAQASQFSFGFSTKVHDREIGLVSYQRRFYSPDLGRWLNRDPIEEQGGENLYAFCANDPVSEVDLQGEISVSDVSCLVNRIRDLKNRLSNALDDLRKCLGTVWSWRPGGSRDSSDNDKYRHCVVSCEIAKACGNRVALALGIVKELRDVFFGIPQSVASSLEKIDAEMTLDSIFNGDSLSDSIEDLTADIMGIDVKNAKGGCACECKKYYAP